MAQLTEAFQSVADDIKALRTTATFDASRITESTSKNFVTAAQKALIGQGPLGENRLFLETRSGHDATGASDQKTVITDAIAVLAAAGGGTLEFKAGGTYDIRGNIQLAGKNIRIRGNGAKLICTTGASAYSYFVTKPGAGVGYGATIQNYLFEDLLFTGTFDPNNAINRCAFSLHHAQNVFIERCTFREMQMGGHTMDLGACDGVFISGCVFEGFWPGGTPTVTGAERSECIQIDTSDNGARSETNDPGDFDGLFCRRIVVDNNRFVPLTVTYGGTTVTHPCPNPMGAHSVREGRFYEDIWFTNNVVIDPVEDLTTAAFRGVLHFPTVRRLRILDNTFIQTTNRVSRVITVLSEVTGTTAASDPNSASPTKATWATPGSSRDIIIRGNTFDGFKPAGGTAPQACVAVVGYATAYIEDVTLGNYFRDGYNDASNPGEYAMTATYARGLTITPETRVERYQGAIFCSTASDTVTVGGSYSDIYAASGNTLAYGFSFNGVASLKIDAHIQRQRRPILVNNCQGGLIGGIFTDIRSSTSEGAINVSSSNAIMVAGATITVLDGTTHANGVSVYGTSSNFSGWVNPAGTITTPVLLGGSGTNNRRLDLAAVALLTGASDIEITDATKGVILRASNGTRYRITVSTAGALTTTAL